MVTHGSKYVQFCLFAIYTLVFVCTAQCCDNGTFTYIDGTCKDYLTCTNILKAVQITDQMMGGRVKEQFLGKLDEMLVVFSTPTESSMREDFLHGIQMLLAFQGTSHVTDLVGYCMDNDNLMVGFPLSFGILY